MGRKVGTNIIVKVNQSCMLKDKVYEMYSFLKILVNTTGRSASVWLVKNVCRKLNNLNQRFMYVLAFDQTHLTLSRVGIEL